MFGPNVHSFAIPRGKVREDLAGTYSIDQHVGHPNTMLRRLTILLVVNPSQLFTVEIPASCFQDNARFIKDVYLEGSSTSPNSEVENFFLIFQLFAQVTYYAMRLSDAVIHGSGDAETGEMNEETATAEQYLGQSEEENQVFAFIEGIPSKEDKKRDAMIRLWIIPQKMLFFLVIFQHFYLKSLQAKSLKREKESLKIAM